MKYQTCYRFDEDGFFETDITCQVDDGGLLLAKNSTPVAPDFALLATNWLKWDGSAWLPVPKPTTAAECAALGEIPHKSQTKRSHEARVLMDSLCEASAEWKVEQDPETLAKRVVAIPPKTEQELYDEAAEEVRMKRDSLIAETDYLLAPDYPIEPESLEAVKVYRQALRDVPQQEGFPFDVEWPTMPVVQKA